MSARKKSKTGKGKSLQTLAAGRAKSKTKKKKASGVAATLPDDGGLKKDYGNPDARLAAIFSILKDASLHRRAVPMEKLMSVGLSKRQIQRYLGILRMKPYSFTVEYDSQRRGHHIANVKEGDYLALGPSLLHRHKVALEVARQALAVFDGANFANLIDESLERITGFKISSENLGLGIPITKLVAFHTPGASVSNSHVFNAITDCLLNQHVLEIDYIRQFFPDVVREKLLLEPLHLACVGGEWVLLARDRSRKPADYPIRTYRVCRFRKPIQTNIPFKYPSDFEPSEHLRSYFRVQSGDSSSNPVLVKLWFSERTSHHIIERKWHPSQKVTILPKREIEVEFNVSNTFEVTRWIMGFGSDCKVLSPDKLREEIATEARLMLERYGHGIFP